MAALEFRPWTCSWGLQGQLKKASTRLLGSVPGALPGCRKAYWYRIAPFSWLFIKYFSFSFSVSLPFPLFPFRIYEGVGNTSSELAEDGVLDIDTTISLETTWHAMEDLVSNGLVRSIGIRYCNSH